MAKPPRNPHRFVPTLTTVLELPPDSPIAGVASELAAPVPTVIEPAQAVALDPQAQLSEADAFRLEEQLLHRVLQSIDLSLEDAVSAVVQKHLDAMIPRLRAEIEAALRTLVSEALAQELSDNTGSTPAFRPQSLG